LKFRADGLEIELSPESLRVKREAVEGEDLGAPPKDKWSDFPTGTLSDEQLMYYSSGGLPENDPFRTDGDGGDA
jgi:hypothetical protein